MDWSWLNSSFKNSKWFLINVVFLRRMQPPPLCRLLYAIFTNYKCSKMGCVEGRRLQEFRLNMMQLDQPDESVSKWVSFQTNDDRQKMAELNQGGIVQFRGQHWEREREKDFEHDIAALFPQLTQVLNNVTNCSCLPDYFIYIPFQDR